MTPPLPPDRLPWTLPHAVNATVELHTEEITGAECHRIARQYIKTQYGIVSDRCPPVSKVVYHVAFSNTFTTCS
jgi:hypothetical protein